MTAAMSSGQPMRLSTTPETTPSPAVKQVYKIFTTRVHALAAAPAFALVSEFHESPTMGGSLKCVPPVHRTPDQMPLIGSSVIPSPPDTRPHASRGCRGPPDLHSHVILAMRMPLSGVSGQGLLPGGLSACGPWWLATSPSCQSASEAVGPSPGVARCRVWGSGVGVVFDRHDQQLGAVGLLCWVERGR